MICFNGIAHKSRNLILRKFIIFPWNEWLVHTTYFTIVKSMQSWYLACLFFRFYLVPYSFMLLISNKIQNHNRKYIFLTVNCLFSDSWHSKYSFFPMKNIIHIMLNLEHECWYSALMLDGISFFYMTFLNISIFVSDIFEFLSKLSRTLALLWRWLI